jgi:choline dehydrogenase-like flavoprotein
MAAELSYRAEAAAEYDRAIFRAYVYPYMDRPNLTVLTQALVTRLTLDGNKAIGVEFLPGGELHHIGAALLLLVFRFARSGTSRRSPRPA